MEDTGGCFKVLIVYHFTITGYRQLYTKIVPGGSMTRLRISLLRDFPLTSVTVQSSMISEVPWKGRSTVNCKVSTW